MSVGELIFLKLLLKHYNSSYKQKWPAIKNIKFKRREKSFTDKHCLTKYVFSRLFSHSLAWYLIDQTICPVKNTTISSRILLIL